MKRVPWLRGAALAKLTLSLRVTGTRPDGFHDIEALTVSTTGPADFVHVNRRRRRGISIVVQPGGTAPATPDNLAVRAAELVWSELGWRGGLRIRLRKQVPPGGGLGGGSSDAAAVLRLLGHVGGIAEERLFDFAAELGSDVPFCVRGTPAWMRGRGEVLDRIDGIPPLMVLVAVPPFGCSTPAVYRAWDDLGGPTGGREVPVPPPFAHLLPALVNDLEPAAEHVEPRLAAFRDRLEAVLQQPVLLCGSGSSYAAWFDDPETWRAAVEYARTHMPSAQIFGGTTI